MSQYEVKRNVIEAFKLTIDSRDCFMSWCVEYAFYGWKMTSTGIELPWCDAMGEHVVAHMGSWIVKRGDEFEWWKDEDFHKEFKEIESTAVQMLNVRNKT